VGLDGSWAYTTSFGFRDINFGTSNLEVKSPFTAEITLHLKPFNAKKELKICLFPKF